MNQQSLPYSHGSGQGSGQGSVPHVSGAASARSAAGPGGRSKPVSVGHGTSRPRGGGTVALGAAALLLAVSGGLLATYAAAGDEASAGTGAVTAPPADTEAVRAAAAAFIDGEVTVRIGEHSVTRPWRELGLTVDERGLAVAARAVAARDQPPGAGGAGGAGGVGDALRAAGALPVILDRARALEALTALKAEHDQSPANARMDLERRTIHPHRDGQSLDLYGALPALEAAARTGAEAATLPVVAIPAEVTVAELGIDDISHVLATFTTRFAVADRSRNYNLKLAASKLNGYVMQPGVVMSFNDVVGARTENEGYKIAHVIQAGQMVDGLAGGTCQISTTLHGAAFFAGIGIVKSLPHSRPSTYVQMGLDATVVYPIVDLVLRNDYDFPVVIHYKVARGESTVEILGKERPYDKIAFERKILEQLDFDTVTREDDTMPVGSMKVDQFGFYGYKVERLRRYYKNGKAVKRDKWVLRYAPVTEYVRTGSNPDPNLPPPKENKKRKRLREPAQTSYRLVQ